MTLVLLCALSVLVPFSVVRTTLPASGTQQL